MPEPLCLVVVGDSFAFTDHRGPQLPDEPTLFPNVAADRLRTALGRPVRTWTVARAGWGVREVWRAVTKDRHVQFEVLAEADALVLAVGSYDHLPAGVPSSLEALAPYLRPARVRRAYRRLLGGVTPWSIRATGGRFRRVPVGEFARLYDAIVGQVRGLTHGAPTVALGPAGHDAERYGRRNPHLRSGEAVQERIAARHGVAFAPVRELVERHVGALNPDGIHWPPAVHAAVGEIAGTVLAEQLIGERPSPPDPWDDLPVGE